MMLSVQVCASLRDTQDQGAVPDFITRPCHEARETLVEPEELRGILPGVVEGAEFRGAQALDVPGVEEFVGDEGEEFEVALGPVQQKESARSELESGAPGRPWPRG